MLWARATVKSIAIGERKNFVLRLPPPLLSIKAQLRTGLSAFRIFLI